MSGVDFCVARRMHYRHTAEAFTTPLVHRDAIRHPINVPRGK